VVAPTGEVVARTSLFERTTLAADVAARSELTPYVRFGDWLPTICVLALVVRVVLSSVSICGRWTGAIGLPTLESEAQPQDRAAG
jgi:apolipoprotein N-acyltransferase